MSNTWDGLLVIDKPGGLTSRNVVDRVQVLLPSGVRTGHTGTLDPLATGVLVIGVGRATRLTEYVQDMGKTYFTTIRLGATSNTDDADGVITPVESEAPSLATIEQAYSRFLGEIEQVPPAFSAAKVTGKRAYALARQGKDVRLPPRRIHIDRIEMCRYAWPELDLVIDCGKGTYIRSLARDLGASLGCGGLVQVLRRTRVGPFRAEQALTLERATLLATDLLPLASAVSDLPAFRLGPDEVRAIAQGKTVRITDLPADREVALFDEEGNLIAVARPDPDHGSVRPVKVLRR